MPRLLRDNQTCFNSRVGYKEQQGFNNEKNAYQCYAS